MATILIIIPENQLFKCHARLNSGGGTQCPRVPPYFDPRLNDKSCSPVHSARLNSTRLDMEFIFQVLNIFS